MINNPLAFSDVRPLQYFAVVAEEKNLRRAAERLFMSQPPLSRQIRQLEERLGLELFVRHSRGLVLTEDGRKVLEIIRPLLKLREETFARLQELANPREKVFALGLSTAFEQGVFSGLEKVLRGRYGRHLRLVRGTSPKLAAGVRKGRLDAALAALPLEAPGLEVRPLAYSEPLVAALPGIWPEAAIRNPPLRVLNGKPLFWFRREGNPAFFDFCKGVFALAGYTPAYLEEPAEHDVLLARIAAGEGMGLLPASFAAIRRKGVVFVPIAEGGMLRVRPGVLTVRGRAEEDFAREIAEVIPAQDNG